MNRLSPVSPFARLTAILAVAATLVTASCTRFPNIEEEPRASSGPVSLRILAYNIRHGLGMDDSVDLERSARLINSLQPDIVTLQEVDNGTERTGNVDQAAVLAQLTGMHGVFGAFMDYQGGQYGMALLSRFPVLDYQNHLLPEGAEPRSTLAARIRIEPADREIIVVGIHLYATEQERLAQAQTIVELYRTESIPVILAGDFNSEPESAVMRLLQTIWELPAKGEDHLTFPADNPDREIDFILFRPDNMFRVTESRVIDEPLVSDHRPVVLTLEISDQR